MVRYCQEKKAMIDSARIEKILSKTIRVLCINNFPVFRHNDMRNSLRQRFSSQRVVSKQGHLTYFKTPLFDSLSRIYTQASETSVCTKNPIISQAFFCMANRLAPTFYHECVFQFHHQHTSLLSQHLLPLLQQRTPHQMIQHEYL